ncbi:TRAP transporter small permease [Thermodesulfobacteriota bacterium]
MQEHAKQNYGLLIKTINVVLIILMVALLLLAFVNVALRYVFSYPLHWSEELIRFIFLWVVMLGATVGVARGGVHISIDFFYDKFPYKLQLIFKLVINVIIFLFLTVFFYYALKILMVTYDQPSLTLDIPMSVPYSSMIAFSGLSIFYTIKNIITDIRNIKTDW